MSQAPRHSKPVTKKSSSPSAAALKASSRRSPPRIQQEMLVQTSIRCEPTGVVWRRS
jgi:hypothetical protein